MGMNGLLFGERARYESAFGLIPTRTDLAHELNHPLEQVNQVKATGRRRGRVEGARIAPSLSDENAESHLQIVAKGFEQIKTLAKSWCCASVRGQITPRLGRTRQGMSSNGHC